MIYKIKSNLKKFVRMFGFEIRRYDMSAASISLDSALRSTKATVLFDIGANIGQFARQVRSNGYRGLIVSFEPLNDAWFELNEVSRKDPMWVVHERCAVGYRSSLGVLNVSRNSVSSSLMRMLDAHVKAAPESCYIREEQVSVFSLDEVGSAYLSDDSVVFIKIDAQGYEGEILQGAEGLLRRASGLICELSLLDLYAGQWSLTQIISYLNDFGFDLWALKEGFINPSNGRVMQVDGIFIKRDSI